MFQAHGIARAPAPARRRRLPVIPQELTTKGRGLGPRPRLDIYRYLLLGWPYGDIADCVGVSLSEVYRIEQNLKLYGSTRKPSSNATLGRPRKLSTEDEQALYDELFQSGWMYQDEIVYWLWMERGVHVHRSTISRLLKDRGWSERALRPISILRNEELRESYRACMRQFNAADLVFLDESIFNEKTGWRHKAYAPIGFTNRYFQDVRRGKTWAILPAYTVNGYLPCTGIKEGYYNNEEFLEWIREALLPTLRAAYGQKPMVIVLDNVSIHTNWEVVSVLEGAGHIVRFLPPYSPDFNPIELTFGVLKAWIRRNYSRVRERFSNFGDFLRGSIRESRCDRFARKHFKYAADGVYRIESQEQLWEARREMWRWE